MAEQQKLSWFKKFLNTFKSEEEILQEAKQETPIVRPYINIKMVNNVLTVLLNDGDILIKKDATNDDYEAVKNSTSRYAIEILMGSNNRIETDDYVKLKEQSVVKILNNLDTLSDVKDFIVEENSLYLKGNKGDKIERSVPRLLADKFVDVVSKFKNDDGSINDSIYDDVEYQSLKKFWMKCCLSPNAKSAEDLYEFLNKHQFKIDRHGNFYAYRRVVS